MPDGAILVPGIITPAEIAYGDLRVALGDERTIVLHDLAIYDGPSPPDGDHIRNTKKVVWQFLRTMAQY